MWLTNGSRPPQGAQPTPVAVVQRSSTREPQLVWPLGAVRRKALKSEPIVLRFELECLVETRWKWNKNGEGGGRKVRHARDV